MASGVDKGCDAKLLKNAVFWARKNEGLVGLENNLSMFFFLISRKPHLIAEGYPWSPGSTRNQESCWGEAVSSFQFAQNWLRGSSETHRKTLWLMRFTRALLAYVRPQWRFSRSTWPCFNPCYLLLLALSLSRSHIFHQPLHRWYESDLQSNPKNRINSGAWYSIPWQSKQTW